jgi:CubicO group peptidase (beta-lactamase class C family)
MRAPSHVPLPRAARLIETGIERGLHHGMQVFVSCEFRPVASLAWGGNRPGEPFSTETLMLWLSSGKPVTAAAVMMLVETGDLELDRPVRDVIPEFGQAGKEGITLRHLLTHTAGLRPVVSGWPHQAWEQIVRRICKAPLQEGWKPGEKAGYDPARSWFILGEMIRRIDGRPIDRFVREEVLEPLGMMDSWLAIPPHLHRAYGNRIGVMHTLKDRKLVPTHSHEQEVCAQPSPGGSMRGPASELGAFYEMLLRGGARASGTQLLQERTVALMTRRHREGMHDGTFKHVVDYGLGVIVNSNRYGAETVPYGYGRHCSEETYGHGGAQSSVGFADPEHQLVVVAIANGSPGEQLHNERFRELLTAVYEDLDLSR